MFDSTNLKYRKNRSNSCIYTAANVSHRIADSMSNLFNVINSEYYIIEHYSYYHVSPGILKCIF